MSEPAPASPPPAPAASASPSLPSPSPPRQSPLPSSPSPAVSVRDELGKSPSPTPARAAHAEARTGTPSPLLSSPPPAAAATGRAASPSVTAASAVKPPARPPSSSPPPPSSSRPPSAATTGGAAAGKKASPAPSQQKKKSPPASARSEERKARAEDTDKEEKEEEKEGEEDGGEEEEEEEEDDGDDDDEGEEEEEDDAGYYEELDDSTGAVVRRRRRNNVKRRGGSSRVRNRFIDDEVEVSTDEEVSSDEELDDDELMIDDDDDEAALIIDDDEIHVDDDDDTKRRKERSRALKRRKGRKRRRRRQEPALDDEDYRLIAENLGIQVRPSIDDDIVQDEDEQEERGKRRRLKRDTTVRSEDMFMPVMPSLQDEMDDSRRASMAEEEKDRAFIDNGDRDRTAGRKRRIDESEGLDDRMMDDDAGQGRRGGAGEQQQAEGREDDAGVDEDEDEDEWRRGGRSGRTGKLQSLFGNVKSFLSESQLLGRRAADDQPADDAEEDAAVQRIKRKADKRKREDERRKADAADPNRVIRDTDVPERMQSRVQRQAAFAALSPEQQKEEMREEAVWLLRQMGNEQTGGDAEQEAMLGWVVGVLEQLRVHRMELPYIICYKPEVWGDDGDRALTEEQLWTIDRLDAQWDLLQLRRRRLSSLVSRYADDDRQLRELLRFSLHSDDLDDVQDHVRHLSIIRQARHAAQSASASGAQDEAAAAVADKRRSTSAILRRAEYSLTRSVVSSGLDALASRIGISAQQLGENLRLGYHLHMPADPPYELESAASAFLGSRYGSVEAVMEAMVAFAALRLSCDAVVRQQLKRLVWDRCAVSTLPTAKGKREVDDSHDYASVLHVARKPVAAFASSPAQFLLMGKALKEGFLELKVELVKEEESGGGGGDPVLRQLSELYLSQGRDDDAKAWNAQRQAVLSRAYQSLLALCLVHVKGRLLRDGIDAVIRGSERKLYHLLTAGPFNPPATFNAREEAAGSRRDSWKIISGCAGDESSPSCFVVLNRYGFALDTLALHFLKSKASARNRDGSTLTEGERIAYARKKEDINRFSALVDKHRPLLIALDASSLDVLQLKAEIEQKCVMEHAETRVELFDPQLARVFSTSARSEIEFREFDRSTRLAISLGRGLLDPVSEICATWSSPLQPAGGLLASLGLLGREAEGLRRAAVQASSNPLANDILALHLHPLQSSVPVSQLLGALQRSIVRVVNKVGVDINRLTTRPWLTAALQFVCGLGPVKAQAVMAAVKREGFLENRQKLLRKKKAAAGGQQAADGAAGQQEEDDGIVGPCVFSNCAGFIRVHRNTEMDSADAVDDPLLDTMLDQTRIHPDRYELAVQIAIEALDVPEDAEEEEEETAGDREATEEEKTFRKQARHVKQLMTSPQRSTLLDTLDLVAFARMEYEERGTRILRTLQHIRSELITPFDTSAVLRPFTVPSPAELFTCLTGESSRSLRDGLLLTVQVQGFTARGVYVTLDGGLRGFLRTENVSASAPLLDYKSPDDREQAVRWLKARLAMGQAVEVRVMKVEKDKLPYNVDVSSRSADRASYRQSVNLADDWRLGSEEERLFMRDNYSVALPTAEEKAQEELAALRSEFKRRPFIPRAVRHPSFRNCTREEAIAELESMPAGEAVIRPSSAGTNRLVVTWKVSDDVYGHVEVREGGKGANAVNALELGSELRIGEQQFEDLDEIVARFIAPMARHAARLLEHKNFRLGDAQEIESILRVEKEQFPRKIPYALSFSCDDRGSFRSFLFSFLPADRVRTEKITVGPKGFGFEGKTYTDPQLLIAALKHAIKGAGTPAVVQQLLKPAPAPAAAPPPPPPPPPRPAPPPVQPPVRPAAAPAAPAVAHYPAPATSGFVHPSRAVPGSGAPPPPPPAAAALYGYTGPPPPQPPAGAGLEMYAGRSSRWGQAPGQAPTPIPPPPPPPPPPYGQRPPYYPGMMPPHPSYPPPTQHYAR